MGIISGLFKSRDKSTDRVGRTVRLQPHDVLHIPGLGFDGLVGYSPIAMAKNAIGLEIATEEYGSKFFANGAAPSGEVQLQQHTCFATIGGEGKASSKEEQAAGTTVEDFTMTLSVRYCQKSAAIDSTHYRVMFMGEIYNIVNIDHMNFRKKSLKFTCRKERR